MWEIIPLDVATFRLTLAAQISRRLVRDNPGEITEIPCVVWLMTNLRDGRKFLVDAGPSPDSERDSHLHGSINRREDQLLGNALARYGTRLEEIDTIILTHLHWDHALGVLEMPQARVLVQRREARYAAAPLLQEWVSYELNDETGTPYFFRYYHQMRFLDGDTAIEDGVRVITLPGHSPGSQGIVVTTPDGDYVMTGDLLDSFHNLEEEMPTGLFTNLDDFHASVNKVRQLKAQILPSHDYTVFSLFAK